ncbi:hypothetical protein [Clostridium akagii]|uniref:hypothetical protein n=1 Tax=Clostridium akagii TaxID=91623 RepID=UPI00047E1D99|nr:hypothetical protein [Clostridium akagii]
MSYFDSLSPEEFIILANLAAFTLMEGNSNKDNIILGSFLSTVSSIMLSFSAQQNFIKALNEGTGNGFENIPNNVNQPINIPNDM